MAYWRDLRKIQAGGTKSVAHCHFILNYSEEGLFYFENILQQQPRKEMMSQFLLIHSCHHVQA